nr:hypothetical protein [uncultured Pedobacter sp.]
MKFSRKTVKGGVCILVFFLMTLSWTLVSSQSPTKQQQKTITLLPFQYTQLKTHNGPSCVYYMRNASLFNIAVAVNTGAPDSIKYDNGTLFNGIHTLAPGQQIIVIGDFKGKQLNTINLSAQNVAITTMLFCPGN